MYTLLCVRVSMKKGGVSLIAACKKVSLSIFWSFVLVNVLVRVL